MSLNQGVEICGFKLESLILSRLDERLSLSSEKILINFFKLI